MSRSQYGWVICAADALLLFCTVGLASTGFNSYQPYLITIVGLSNTQSSTIILFRTLFKLIGMLFTMRLIKLLEIRRVATLSLILCAISFFIFGSSDNFLMCCVAASLAGISIGIGGMITVSVIIARWFNEHRALALGISMAATGLSAMVASPYIVYTVEAFSLKTSFTVEGTFVLVAAVLYYIFVRSMPECLDTTPIGSSHIEQRKTYAEKDAPKKYYYLMMLGIFLFGIPANVFASHISVIYSNSGFSSANIAIMVSLFGISLAVGKCLYGFVADRVGTYRAGWILYVFSFAGMGLACLSNNGNSTVAFVAVIATGLGFAVTSVSASMYATAVSTEKNYAKTTSRFQILSTVGSLVFGTVPGAIADATGSYYYAVVIMLVITVVSAIIMQVVCKRVQNSSFEQA